LNTGADDKHHKEQIKEVKQPQPQWEA